MKHVLMMAALTFIGATAMAKSAPKTLTVDTASSKLEWTGSKRVGGGHNGTIKVKEGNVVVEKDMIKSGEIVIDMTSIEVLDIPKTDENNGKLLGHLSSPDFFDVKNHPTAKLVIKSAKKDKEATMITGDLTIRGKTQPVSFPVKMEMKDSQTTATGKLTFDRTKHDVKYGSSNFFKLAADKVINNEIGLSFSVVAK